MQQRQLELTPRQRRIGTGIALLVIAAIGGAIFLLARRTRDAATTDASALVARLAGATIVEGIATPGAKELAPDAMGGGLAPDDAFLAGYREIRTETDESMGKKSFATKIDYHALVPFQLATDRAVVAIGPATLDGELSGCHVKSTEDAHVRTIVPGDHVAAIVHGDHVELHCGDAKGWLAAARAAADQPLSTLGLVGMIAAIAGALGGLVQIARGMRTS